MKNNDKKLPWRPYWLWEGPEQPRLWDVDCLFLNNNLDYPLYAECNHKWYVWLNYDYCLGPFSELVDATIEADLYLWREF